MWPTNALPWHGCTMYGLSKHEHVDFTLRNNQNCNVMDTHGGDWKGIESLLPSNLAFFQQLRQPWMSEQSTKVNKSRFVMHLILKKPKFLDMKITVIEPLSTCCRSYEERQQRCQEQYGFTCQCDRCLVWWDIKIFCCYSVCHACVAALHRKDAIEESHSDQHKLYDVMQEVPSLVM